MPKRELIVYIMDGLGNQLFKYATAYAIAKQVGRPLKIHVNPLKQSEDRQYSLGAFALSEHVPLAEPRFPRLWRFALTPRGIYKVPSAIASILLGIKVVREVSSFTFIPDLLERCRTRVRQPVLAGNWQFYQYFEVYRDELLREFGFRFPPEGKNAELVAAISREDDVPISLHVRRGDYLNWSNHVLGASYYRRAMTQMCDAVKSPHFYVFSNDIPWCRKNLSANWPITFVDHNDESKAHEDLRLMAMCRHHIIANSSFSWWAAWLSDFPDKIVLSPDYWFRQRKGIDVCPPGWLFVPTAEEQQGRH